MVDFRNHMAFVGTFFVRICDDFRNAERIGVEWCLGYKAIREGNSEETSDTGCDSEKEQIPVEAGWFAEREFGALGNK